MPSFSIAVSSDSGITAAELEVLKANSNKEEKRIVAIVTPEMGLLEEPTMPAI